ncbi:MAG: DUF6807 family protein [Planctomycetota bacterium]
MKLLSLLVVLPLVLGIWGVAQTAASAEGEKSFTAESDDLGLVVKTPDGRTMFRYMTKKPADTKLTANSVCCLFPVNTPSGERVVDFAPPDHPHHRGVFLAWHAIAGPKAADFWGWGEFAPKENRIIENRDARVVKANQGGAELAVRNDWVAEGQTLIEEATTIAASEDRGAYVIDLDFQLNPRADLTLQETAFGGFCVKSRQEGKSAYYGPDGRVDLPNPHHLKPETDWPAKDWYAYTVALDAGKTFTVAVVDHPENPPSTWHNLQPIAMINPCIVAPGPVELKAGEPLRLRYRLVVHDGPPQTDMLKKLAADWRGIATR